MTEMRTQKSNKKSKNKRSYQRRNRKERKGTPDGATGIAPMSRCTEGNDSSIGGAQRFCEDADTVQRVESDAGGLRRNDMQRPHIIHVIPGFEEKPYESCYNDLYCGCKDRYGVHLRSTPAPKLPTIRKGARTRSLEKK